MLSESRVWCDVALLDLSKVTPSSVLLVRVSSYDDVHKLAEVLRGIKSPHPVPVIFLQEGQDLTILSEREMNAAGWYRK